MQSHTPDYTPRIHRTEREAFRHAVEHLRRVAIWKGWKISKLR